LYYSSQWQVLEEKQGSTVTAQNLWSPVFVDALVERDTIATQSDGSLDTGFDTDGKLTTSFGGNNDVLNRMALQSDGKLIAAGSAGTSGNLDFAIARYNTDGSLDTSFDTDGKQTLNFNGKDDAVNGIVIQSSGKIVVGGYASTSTGDQDFALARFTSAGALDTTFGTSGKTTTDFGTTADQGRCIAVQSDGKIILGGISGSDYAIARYSADGVLDTTFGGGGTGKKTIDFASGFDEGHFIAVQADDKIVFGGVETASAGGVGSTTLRNFGIVRLNADGTIDTGFGTSGKVTSDLSSNLDGAQGVVIQTDGKIVVGGVGTNGSGSKDFFMVRYNTDGSLDSSFGSSGKVATSFTTSDDRVWTLILQPDGKIVAAGSSNTGTLDFAIARYNTDGSLDTSFDTDGKLTVSLSSGADEAYSMVQRPDGKIVLGGYATVATGNQDWALAQLGLPAAPALSITGAPTSSPEGTAISLASSVSPAATGTLSYLWGVTKDGAAFTLPGGTTTTASTFSFTPTDNGSYVVSLTASDSYGGSATDSKTISVSNVAPTVAITGAPTPPASSPEGTAINLSSTASDPAGANDPLSYAWSVTKGGSAYTLPGGTNTTSSTFTFTPDDNTSFVVSLAVSDGDGGSTTDSKTISVTNVAPTAAITGAPTSSPEGTAITLGSTASDPAGANDPLSYAWSVTKGGSAYTLPGGTNTTSSGFSFTPDDNASYVVSLTVSDGDGGSTTDSKTIAVSNVAPTATVGSDTPITLGGQVTISFTDQADASSADATAGFLYSYDFDGDNTFEVYQSTSASRSFTYTAPGVYAAKARIEDKDGGMTDYATTVTVSNAAPQNPAAAAGDGVVDLAWDAVDGATSYSVYRGTSSNAEDATPIAADLTDPFYSDYDVTNGTAYYYTITWTDGNGSESAASAEQTATPAQPPTGLTTTILTGGDVRLAWTNPSSDPSGFIIEGSDDGISFDPVTSVGPGIATIDLTGPLPGTVCYFRMLPPGGGAPSSYSNIASAVAVPDVPSGLTVTETSVSEIDLTWEAASLTDVFSIQRKVGTGDWTSLATTDAGASSYDDMNEAEATEYQYRIRAINSTGTSDYTEAEGTDTWAALPSDAAASIFSDEHIEFSWTDNSSGESAYTVDAKQDDDGWESFGSLPANTTTYITDPVAEPESYVFRVGVTNAIGDTEYTSEFAGAAVQGTLSAPTSLNAEVSDSGSSRSIALTWIDSDSGVTGYKIERSRDGSNWAEIGGSPATSATYADSGLRDDVAYHYRVRAYDDAGDSPYSTPITSDAIVPLPTDPGLAVGNCWATGGKVSIYWLDNSTNETGFRIEQQQDSWQGEWTTAETVGPNAESCTLSGFSPGDYLNFRVVAFNSAGDSAPADVALNNSIPTFDSSVTAPSNLQATLNSNGTSATLSWTPGSASTWIEGSVDGTSFFLYRPRVSDSTLSSVPLLPGKTYTFRAYTYTESSPWYVSDYAVSNTVTSTASLPAPGGLDVASVSASQVQLSWTDTNSGNDAVSYDVQRSADGTNWMDLGDGDATGFTDSTVDDGTTYTYRVNAHETYQYLGSASMFDTRVRARSDAASISASTAPAIPNAPSGLTARVTAGLVDLTWRDNSDNEAGFKVIRSLNGTVDRTVTLSQSDTKRFTDTTVKPNTTYSYQVLAFNNTGESAKSNAATANVPKTTVSIKTTKEQAVEGGTAKGEFTVYRNTGSAAADLVVTYTVSTVSGMARPGVDYAALSGTVTIPAGKRSATIEVSGLANPTWPAAPVSEVVYVILDEGDPSFVPDPNANSAVVTVLNKREHLIAFSGLGDSSVLYGESWLQRMVTIAGEGRVVVFKDWEFERDALKQFFSNIDADGDKQISPAEIEAIADLRVVGFSGGGCAAAKFTREIFEPDVRVAGYELDAAIPVNALDTIDPAGAILGMLPPPFGAYVHSNVEVFHNYYQRRGRAGLMDLLDSNGNMRATDELHPANPEPFSVPFFGSPIKGNSLRSNALSTIQVRIDTTRANVSVQHSYDPAEQTGITGRMKGNVTNHDTVIWFVYDDVMADLMI
jgi:uncharacterized delta-60 repeat protein